MCVGCSCVVGFHLGGVWVVRGCGLRVFVGLCVYVVDVYAVCILCVTWTLGVGVYALGGVGAVCVVCVWPRTVRSQDSAPRGPPGRREKKGMG